MAMAIPLRACGRKTAHINSLEFAITQPKRKDVVDGESIAVTIKGRVRVRRSPAEYRDIGCGKSPRSAASPPRCGNFQQSSDKFSLTCFFCRSKMQPLYFPPVRIPF